MFIRDISETGTDLYAESINKAISSALNFYMKSEKCEVRTLVQKYGFSASSVYKWKRGDACPDFHNLITLADEFGCPLDCLIGREPLDNDYGYIPKPVTKPFCDTFNDIIKEKGLTEYRLVKTMGVSRTKISSWRKGKSLPDAKGLYDLAELLDISADSLVGRE